MGAIVAVYRLDGRSVDRQELTAMMDRMPHRAVDGDGTHVMGSLGLGHGSLRMLPETQPGECPLMVADDAVVVTADARLDNRDDLLRILTFRRPPEEVSDERILAEAYLKWGPEFPEHLMGAFTYCIWDARSNALHCGRDQLGIRPLYYVHVPGRLFACATEIKALLVLDDVEPSMSEFMAALYLESIKEEFERTIYTQVMRVPAATRIEVGSGVFSSEEYWDLHLPPSSEGTDKSFAEQFRAHFDEAVRARVRSTRPVGSQLSGGLDSSYVTCSAVNQLREQLKPLRTYSITFENDRAADESRFIRRIAGRPDITATYLSVDDKGPLDYLDWIYDVLDDGVVGGNYITQVSLIHAAGADGCGVLLDGFDGDTTVEHGYPIFRSLADRGDWSGFYELARQTGAPLINSPVSQQSKIGTYFSQYAFNRYARPAIRAMAARRQYARAGLGVFAARRRRMTSWRQGLALLRDGSPESPSSNDKTEFHFLREDTVRDLEIREYLRNHTSPYGDESIGMRERQSRLIRSGKRARAFEISDHLTSAFQMEQRHPFMDLRLIAFCLSLPEEQSLKNGWTRYVMRNAMAGIVPDEITWRGDKSDMSGVFRTGLLKANRDELIDLVRSPGILVPFIESSKIERQLMSLDDAPTSQLVRLTSFAIGSYWLNRRFGS